MKGMISELKLSLHGTELRTLQHATILQRDDDHLLDLRSIGEENGRVFIAMEMLEGQTLKHRIIGGPMRAAVMRMQWRVCQFWASGRGTSPPALRILIRQLSAVKRRNLQGGG